MYFVVVVTVAVAVGQQPHTVNTTDATMQMFAERAVKSGIRLEALPETST